MPATELLQVPVCDQVILLSNQDPSTLQEYEGHTLHRQKSRRKVNTSKNMQYAKYAKIVVVSIKVHILRSELVQSANFTIKIVKSV